MGWGVVLLTAIHSLAQLGARKKRKDCGDTFQLLAYWGRGRKDALSVLLLPKGEGKERAVGCTGGWVGWGGRILSPTQHHHPLINNTDDLETHYVSSVDGKKNPSKDVLLQTIKLPMWERSPVPGKLGCLYLECVCVSKKSFLPLFQVLHIPSFLKSAAKCLKI